VQDFGDMSNYWFLHYGKKMLIAITFVMVSSSVLAYDFVLDGIYYNKKSDITVEVTYKNLDEGNYTGDIVIPNEINYNGETYKVTAISDWAFSRCSGLKSVTIPFSVESIGNGIFKNCNVEKLVVHSKDIGEKWFVNSPIKELVIGNEVETIGEKSFQCCNGLTSIVVPNNVVSIGGWAFESCKGLISIEIGDGVIEIGEFCFSFCERLSNLKIGDNVKHIGRNAFDYCKGLSSVIIPNSVTTIDERAYNHCTSLSSVVIGDGVVDIGTEAFIGCDNLSTLIFGNHVQNIGDFAFCKCISLHSVVLPNNVLAIGNGAFYGCKEIAAIDLPNNLLKIGWEAFEGCEKLQNIEIPNSVDSIGGHCFKDCSSLMSVTIGKGIQYINGNVFEGCGNLVSATILCPIVGSWFRYSSLKEIVFGNEVTTIEEIAFRGCNGLSSVSLPNSVTSIGNGAFWNCKGLTTIKLGNKTASIGSFAFENCGKLASLVIPDSVVSIGSRAFSGCVSLTSIIVPSSVNNMPNDVFEGCSGIASVVLNCQNIGTWFKGSISVKEVMFGDSVRIIDDNAFENCSSIESLTIPFGVSSIGAAAFKGCSSLKNIEFNAKDCYIKNKSESPFCILPSVENIKFGDGVKAIPNNLTRDLELNSITFGNNVIEIGANAFVRAKIKSVYISDISKWCKIQLGNKEASPLLYADNMFVDGSLVNSITIPNSVSSISDYAFYGFKGYSSLTIPSSVNDIGIEAFANCEGLKRLVFNIKECESLKNSEPFKFSSLEDVVIGNEVLRIPDYFLYNCTKVKSVSIGEKVSHVGKYAFSGCDSLTDVILPNCVETIGEACFMSSGVKNVILSEALTAIPKWAFKGCHIGSIILPKSITSLGEESFVMSRYGRDETSGPGSGHTGHNSVGTVYIKNSNVVSANKAFDYTFDWWNDKYSIPCSAYVPKGSLEKYKKVWPWSVFISLSEWDVPTDVDTSMKDEAIAKYNVGVDVYDSYFYYYKGDGQKTYQTAISKQNDNNKVADDIWYEIGKLKDYVSESNIRKKENESGYYINFNYRVEKNYEPFSDYYNRLAQYKERIETATTNEELDAVIAEIDADAAGMKDYYLNPIIDDYNEMVRISQRFTEIGEELSKYQSKLSEIAKEIELLISAIKTVVMSDGNVMVVNLRGERMTMKSTQIKTLPKGIYIVNGKKYIVR